MTLPRPGWWPVLAHGEGMKGLRERPELPAAEAGVSWEKVRESGSRGLWPTMGRGGVGDGRGGQVGCMAGVWTERNSRTSSFGSRQRMAALRGIEKAPPLDRREESRGEAMTRVGLSIAKDSGS